MDVKQGRIVVSSVIYWTGPVVRVPKLKRQLLIFVQIRLAQSSVLIQYFRRLQFRRENRINAYGSRKMFRLTVLQSDFYCDVL